MNCSPELVWEGNKSTWVQPPNGYAEVKGEAYVLCAVCCEIVREVDKDEHENSKEHRRKKFMVFDGSNPRSIVKVQAAYRRLWREVAIHRKFKWFSVVREHDPPPELFVLKEAEVQSTLDVEKWPPLIGVEYIIEVDNPENGHVREYHCLLCNAVLPDVDQLFTHLRNSDECDHQVKYLNKHMPKYREHMETYSEPCRLDAQEMLNRIACSIQKEYGRNCVWVVRPKVLRKRRPEVLAVLEGRKHVEYSRIYEHTIWKHYQCDCPEGDEARHRRSLRNPSPVYQHHAEESQFGASNIVVCSVVSDSVNATAVDSRSGNVGNESSRSIYGMYPIVYTPERRQGLREKFQKKAESGIKSEEVDLVSSEEDVEKGSSYALSGDRFDSQRPQSSGGTTSEFEFR